MLNLPKKRAAFFRIAFVTSCLRNSNAEDDRVVGTPCPEWERRKAPHSTDVLVSGRLQKRSLVPKQTHRPPRGRDVRVNSHVSLDTRPGLPCRISLLSRGLVMKPYFLALATVLIVGVGCQLDSANFRGDSIVDQGRYHAPPAGLMARPGPMVDGPGPGVLPMLAPAMPAMLVAQTSQVKFLGPPGMHIGWQVSNQAPEYAENQIIAPGRYDFLQGST